MKKFALIAIALTIVAVMTLPASARKKTSDKTSDEAAAEAGTGAQKTVAVGPVEMNQMGFDRMSPEATADLLRMRLKKALEKEGFAVIAPEFKRGDPQMPEAAAEEKVPEPKNAAEAMKMVQQMQAKMEKTMAQMRGEYQHQPVNADALFTFNVSRGQKSMSTGGIVGTAMDLGAPSKAHVADVSSQRQELILTCYQRDPKSGSLLDEHEAKASSTRYLKTGGNYVLEDTSDPEKAYDRLFKRATNNCAKWIAEKMNP